MSKEAEKSDEAAAHASKKAKGDEEVKTADKGEMKEAMKA